MRAYRTYLRKVLRVIKRRTEEMAGFETVPARQRVKVGDPYIRTRPDRRRQTDSDSFRELGKENESYMEYLRENPEAKQELLHEDPQRFKELFPDDYDEWYAESDSRFEEEGDDPHEN